MSYDVAPPPDAGGGATTNGDYRLLATCWTSAGNARPGVTANESPHSLEDRIRAVADAGYVGIGFEYADLVVARDGIGLTRLRDLLDDAGLTAVEVEFIDDWYTAGRRREISDRRRHDLLVIAETLGASHIKVGGGKAGDQITGSALRDEFAQLAGEAAEHGTRVALEAGAFSRLRDLDEAIDVVVDVDNRSGGLLLDVWHLARTGYDYELLSSRVPHWALFAVELADGLTDHDSDLLADTFDHRLHAGSGDFDVPRFVRAIHAIGFDGPWGVEHMSIDHRRQPLAAALTTARDAAIDVLRA